MFVFVVNVERLGECLQVVLGVDQVLDAELTHSEQFNKVRVTDLFQVLAVHLSVSDVLKNLLNLAEVGLANNLVYISVHECAPVDFARPFLKFENWRQGHQT